VGQGHTQSEPDRGGRTETNCRREQLPYLHGPHGRGISPQLLRRGLVRPPPLTPLCRPSQGGTTALFMAAPGPAGPQLGPALTGGSDSTPGRTPSPPREARGAAGGAGAASRRCRRPADREPASPRRVAAPPPPAAALGQGAARPANPPSESPSRPGGGSCRSDIPQALHRFKLVPLDMQDDQYTCQRGVTVIFLLYLENWFCIGLKSFLPWTSIFKAVHSL
jgi:hypothetical protein